MLPPNKRLIQSKNVLFPVDLSCDANTKIGKKEFKVALQGAMQEARSTTYDYKRFVLSTMDKLNDSFRIKSDTLTDEFTKVKRETKKLRELENDNKKLAEEFIGMKLIWMSIKLDWEPK